MLQASELPNQEAKAQVSKESKAVNIVSVCGEPAAPAPPDELPVFDLRPYLEAQQADQLAADMARCLQETGCLVVRDARVGASDNKRFLDLMERYFEQPTEAKMADARPQYHYQVGVTPEGVELPRCAMDPACVASVSQQPPEHRATLPTGPDPKWRYFWRIGERPAVTEFAELNAEPVCPAGFPDWSEVMDGWGAKMLAALQTTSELVALGFGLPLDAFSKLMDKGPHLLGPTGTDLGAHQDTGKSYAGYHYDLNFLTIHGKSRFPGLFVWLADGRRVPVRIPEGCLLLQAGKQMEWLTGGQVKAGMHEVICSDATRAAVVAARARKQSLWRVSSTVFGHIASDQLLQPLGHFALLPSAADYPPIKAGAYVEQELKVISLKASD